jgi:hypothetical protein
LAIAIFFLSHLNAQDAARPGVTASAGQRRGDVEIRSYLQDAAGRRSLVFDLSMTHDRSSWEQ